MDDFDKRKFNEVEAALNTLGEKAFRAVFLNLLRFDQTVIYANVQPDEREVINRFLTIEELGKIFDALEVEEMETIRFLKEMTPRLASAILSDMYMDNLADLLGRMSRSDLATYLNLLPKEQIQEVRELLNYHERTAGAIMTTEYISVNQNEIVASVMEIVRKRASQAEIIYYVYVEDETEVLVGVVTLRELIMNDDSLTVKQFMKTNVFKVLVEDDQEIVAQRVKEYNFLAVPVVNTTDHLLGIITVDDIIDVMDEESTEDYSGLAGVKVDGDEQSPWISALHRMPWLLTLLVLGMSTASLINHFDSLVSQASILAVFISLITGTAGNAGTQSLAIAVRKISVQNDHKIWKIIRNEVITGIIIGVFAAISITIIVEFWKHSLALGMVVGISMAAAITVANLAGSLIPILMDKIGVDPAVASGPFISTLSDLTSVLIYFSVAQIFINSIM